METGIGGAVLTIVAKKMTPKAFCEGTSRSRVKGSRMREYLSGRGEYLSAIRESDVLGNVPRDREDIVFFIGKVIVRHRGVYCSGRRGSLLRTLRLPWYSFSFFFLCHSLPLLS